MCSCLSTATTLKTHTHSHLVVSLAAASAATGATKTSTSTHTALSLSHAHTHHAHRPPKHTHQFLFLLRFPCLVWVPVALLPHQRDDQFVSTLPTCRLLDTGCIPPPAASLFVSPEPELCVPLGRVAALKRCNPVRSTHMSSLWLGPCAGQARREGMKRKFAAR